MLRPRPRPGLHNWTRRRVLARCRYNIGRNASIRARTVACRVTSTGVGAAAPGDAQTRDNLLEPPVWASLEQKGAKHDAYTRYYQGEYSVVGDLDAAAFSPNPIAYLTALVQARGPTWGTIVILLAMQEVVALKQRRGAAEEPFDAQECQVMALLGALLCYRAKQLPDIRDPVTAIYSCTQGRYWPPKLLDALFGRLEDDDGDMLRRDANGCSYGNLFWSIGEAAECSAQDANAAALVQRATKPGGVLDIMASVITSPEACSRARFGKEEGFPMHVVSICAILMACVRIPYTHDRQLLDQLVSGFITAPRCDSQDLSNILHCLGKLTTIEDNPYMPAQAQLAVVLSRVDEALTLNASGFKPQELVIVLYALVQLKPPASAQPLVARLAQECTRREFCGFSAREISNTVWALAQMGYADQQHYRTACDTLIFHQQARARIQDWCNTIYGLALVRHLDDLVATVAARTDLSADAATITPQLCVDTLWACATLGPACDPEPLVSAFMPTVTSHVVDGNFTAHHLTTLLWALAVLNQLGEHQAVVQLLMAEAHKLPVKDFTHEQLSQLWATHAEAVYRRLGQQCMLHGQLLAAAKRRVLAPQTSVGVSAAPSLLDSIIATLAGMIGSSHIGRMQMTAAPHLQRYVFGSNTTLEGQEGQADSSSPPMPIDHCIVQLQWRPETGMWSAGSPDMTVALMTTSASDYFTNWPFQGTFIGSARLRDRWLSRAFDGGVGTVEESDWDALQGDEAGRRALLVRSLQEAVACLGLEELRE